jgi:hypothetical protein
MIFNQGLVKIFQSRSAENFLIKVRFEISNHGLVDPDQVFDRVRDRD